jgi:hypothetical protein
MRLALKQNSHYKQKTRAIFVKNRRILVPRKHFSRICAVTGWDSNIVPSEYKLEVRALEAADPVISLWHESNWNGRIYLSSAVILSIHK